MLGLCSCVEFSLVVVVGDYSLVLHRLLILETSHCGGFCFGAQAIDHLGFSSYGSRALEHRLSSCCHGLSCSRHVGCYQTRGGTSVSCIGRQILYGWATREAPGRIFKFIHVPPKRISQDSGSHLFWGSEMRLFRVELPNLLCARPFWK